MIRLHNMNRIHTFIDVESGQFISLPKDLTDKPPVNADINNNIDTFHSTGGEGTPSEPIDIVNISEYDKTVCGEQFFNINGELLLQGNETYVVSGTQISVTGSWYVYQIIKVSPNTDYYLNYEKLSGIGYISIYGLTQGDLIKTGVGVFNTGNRDEIRVVLYASQGTSTTTVFKDITFTLGITAPTSYIYFISSITYPYRLEDTDGALHYGGDLPDGTADSFDGTVLVSNIGSVVIDESTVIAKSNDISTQPLLARFVYSDSSIAYGGGVNLTDTYCRATHLKGVGWSVSNTAGIDYEYCWLNPSAVPLLQFQILKSRFSDYANLTNAERIAEFKTLINGCVVEYKLATPQTYQIKQYGETYGGQVWNKNEKPKSIQYHTNIFTDKNIDIQCEVRKLGNRAMAYFDLATVSGELLQTVSGEQIQVKI